MSTLSRREEETLLKTTKAHALKECDTLVKGALTAMSLSLLNFTFHVAFADCAAGRTVSVAWACREKFRAIQECMYQL
jgi:COX assembly protein 1